MSGPPDPLVFFTDRDLGKRFPASLSEAGLTVVRHADLFEPACPDDEWLAKVGSEGWIAVSRDARIRYKPNEKEAVLLHGVRLLVLVGQIPLPQLAANFMATVDKITIFVAQHPAPWIAKVYRPPSNAADGSSGSLSLWLSGV